MILSEGTPETPRNLSLVEDLKVSELSVSTLVSLQPRINLSPFTKDFRGEEHYNESMTNFCNPALQGDKTQNQGKHYTALWMGLSRPVPTRSRVAGLNILQPGNVFGV